MILSSFLSYRCVIDPPFLMGTSPTSGSLTLNFLGDLCNTSTIEGCDSAGRILLSCLFFALSINAVCYLYNRSSVGFLEVIIVILSSIFFSTYDEPTIYFLKNRDLIEAVL